MRRFSKNALTRVRYYEKSGITVHDPEGFLFLYVVSMSPGSAIDVRFSYCSTYASGCIIEHGGGDDSDGVPEEALRGAQ